MVQISATTLLQVCYDYTTDNPFYYTAHIRLIYDYDTAKVRPKGACNQGVAKRIQILYSDTKSSRHYGTVGPTCYRTYVGSTNDTTHKA